MRVSLDDGATWQEVDGVRVERDVFLGNPDDNHPAQLLLNHTHEGLILDLIERGEVVGSAGWLEDDLVEMTY